VIKRSDKKVDSLNRILDAAAVRLRCEGLSGAAIAPVMADAGLTQGAFYSHFANKDELATAAFRRALDENRRRWVGTLQDANWAERLTRIGSRYLTAAHRDNLHDSCALGALCSEAGRSEVPFRTVFEEELLKSLDSICDCPGLGEHGEAGRADDAIAFMALCIGGISMARAVSDRAFADRILAICRTAAPRLAGPPGPKQEKGNKMAEPSIDDYPLRTSDKLRYADTDRQGHVNNAVFSTLLEFGRAELLLDPATPLAEQGAAFVIARLDLDFRSEMTWPGTVDIGTRIVTIGRSSLTLRQGLFQDGRCAATAETVIVQMDEATRRSRPLSPAAVERLHSLMQPVPAD